MINGPDDASSNNNPPPLIRAPFIPAPPPVNAPTDPGPRPNPPVVVVTVPAVIVLLGTIAVPVAVPIIPHALALAHALEFVYPFGEVMVVVPLAGIGYGGAAATLGGSAADPCERGNGRWKGEDGRLPLPLLLVVVWFRLSLQLLAQAGIG